MLPKHTARILTSAATLCVACGPAWAVADWQQLKRDADTAYSGNNYGVAERGYLEALKQAEKFGPADVRLADTLKALVALYSTRALFSKAEPLFEHELSVREKALGGEHPDVVATVGRLAQFYLDHGSSAKAERLTNLILSFAERKVKDQQTVNDEFNRLSKYYDRSREYAEAQEILHKLEETTHKTTANQDLELATTLDALGRTYQARKRYDVAEKMFKDALAMRQRTLSPAHMALAFSYENLANLYAAQDKEDQAQSYYKQALEVTEKTLQPGRPEFFARLDQLARTNESLGQTAEAEQLYKRALTVIDKVSPNSYDAGRAAYALGTLYLKQGRFTQAEPLMKRALKASESANGSEHAAVAPILDSYADVLEKVNKVGEAGRLRARARSIRGASVVQSGSDF